MKTIRFEFGEDIKKYLEEEASHTLTINSVRSESEYSVQYEFITSTTPPKEEKLDLFEKYSQNGIEFYLSKDQIDLDKISTVRLSVNEYESDLAGRSLKVELL